jgi:HK97 family phage major capsid protein
VIRGVKNISPIRAIAGNRVVSASVYKKPFAITGPSTGWVAETATRPETNSPTLAELTFPTMEIYAMPSATQTLLDDSAVNIDEWLAEEVQIAFAQQEGTAFVSGDGTNKPKGFLAYTKVANGSWSWGNIGYVATGTDGAFDTTNPSDDLITSSTRLHLRAEVGVPRQRPLGDEPGDTGHDPQVQGCRRQLHLAAGGAG